MRPSLALILLTLLLLSSTGTKAAEPARRVVLALVPAVSAVDLDPARMPNFRCLTEHGAVGLMNTRTAALRWPTEAARLTVDPARGSAYLTLGAGTRCAVGPLGAEAFGLYERTGEGMAATVYARRNLRTEIAGGLQLNPRAIEEMNTGIGYRAQPGALGELLRQNGIATAVLGEADRPEEIHREGALAAMDTRGRVVRTALNTSVPMPSAPFGRALSLPRLDKELKAALDRSRFVVLDWGDTARLDDQRAVMLPAATDTANRWAMDRLDAGFGLLRKHLDFERDRLLIVVPYPSRRARAAYDLLTPVVQVGGTPPGLLRSPTTRRAGVLANVDIAPTVAGAFGITTFPTTFVGRPVAGVSAPDAWSQLLELRSRLLEVERERRNVLRDLVSLLTFGMLAFAALFLASKGGAARWLPLTLVFLAPALPLALLLLAFVAWPSVGAFTFALLILTFGLAGGAAALTRLRRRALDGIAALALATVAFVVADGLAGFPHMPYCILSYSLMEGARYYGIGNEYMGASLAATTLGGTALFARRERKLPLAPRAGVIALFLLCTLVLAGPAFGAKFGGGVSAAGGFGFCILLLSLRRVRARHLVAILIGIAGVIAFMVLLDQMRGGQSSHIGRAFAAVRGEGWGELEMILTRKASMNFRLLMFSPWSRLMGAALLASVAGILVRRSRRLPALPSGPVGAGIAGTLAAALVAFLVDDAGVLAAATALIFVPPALLAADRDEYGRL
ncbi:MAG: hypothetical protein KY468_00630 [Armatimonadetes bacterium]|nr:hypothetical protein [Armatimonadota bacterium]